METRQDFVIENGVLTRYIGPGGAVVIPEGVEEIGFQAFKDQRGVMSVEFPKGLKRLRKEAFAGCVGLSRLVLPEGVKETGAYAFAGCTALTSVSLPESVFKISDSAFKDCPELKDINIPKGLQSIGRNAFRNCAVLPDLDLPEGLLEIGKHAFENCKAMEALTIPASVQKLGEEIVSKSGIKTVTLLGNVRQLAKNAFQWYYGRLSAIHTPISCFCPDSKWQLVQSFAKAYCDGAELDPEVKSDYIGYIRRYRKVLCEFALEQEDLMQLIVWEKVIPKEQFQDVLDKSIQMGKTELTALLLEYSKENFPPLDPVKEAEKGFRAMEREVKALETYQKTGVLTVALAKKDWNYGSDGEQGISLIGWKGKGLEIVTPKIIGRKPVTGIGPNAFFKSRITSATVSEGVKIIRDGAFWDCTQLTRITLPKSLNLLADGVFMGCAALTEIRLPGKLKRIGSTTFCGCESLTEVVIPEKVTEIAWNAFANCHNLESVTIPASATDISLAAFTDCPKLTIRAPAGSYAEQFAKEHNIPFDTL